MNIRGGASSWAAAVSLMAGALLAPSPSMAQPSTSPAGAAVESPQPAPAPLRLELPPQATSALSSGSQASSPPAALREPTSLAEGSIYFVGTATVVIRYAGLTILTDPNFLHRGDQVHLGYGLRSTRVTEPALQLADLPPIDLVVLSHFHGDHFDQLVQRQLNKAMPIVSTPSAVHALRKLGFTQTYALERWQTLEVGKGGLRLKVTSMPGRHGPAVVAKALPPVMGSMLEFQTPTARTSYRLYVSGDTTIIDDLKDIPKRYPDVDMALLHLGGTRIGGVIVTMDAKQGIQALHIVDPKHAIPIHFDDYGVFKSPLSDFVQAVREAGLQDKVTYLGRGDSYRFQVPPDRQR